MRGIVTFILAGGQGNRLHPLTLNQAKPAVSYGGSLCLLDLTLLNCYRSGLKEIHVLAQYRVESLLERLRTGWGPLEDWGAMTVFARTPRSPSSLYRGTGDAVWQNIDLVPRRDEDGDVLILSGDHVYDMDYRQFLDHHHRVGADLTIGATPVPEHEAYRFGILERAVGGRVVSFKEKPKRTDDIRSGIMLADGGMPFLWASMGIYAFRASVLREALARGPALDRGFDFGRDIIPPLLESKKVHAYDFVDQRGSPSYWRDVGAVMAYYEAQMDLVAEDPAFRIEIPSTFPSSRLREHTLLKDRRSLVSNRSSVRGEIYQSVIAPGAVVERGAHVVRSVVLEGAVVERGVMIDGVVVGQYARLADRSADEDTAELSEAAGAGSPALCRVRM